MPVFLASAVCSGRIADRPRRTRALALLLLLAASPSSFAAAPPSAPVEPVVTELPLPGHGPPDAAESLRQAPLLPSAPPGEATLERSGLRYHFLPPDRLAAEELAHSGGRVRAAITASFGREIPGRFDIYLAHDRRAFADLLGGEAPEWMAGVSLGRSRWAAVRLDPRGEAPWAEVERTFRHELAHLLLHAATAGSAAVPRWFSEGFAIHQAEDWSFERARTLAEGIVQGRIVPLAELTQRFPERPADVQLAYAQSVAFTAFLLREGQDGEFGRVLRYLADGATFPEALRRAYGRPLAELEQQWRDQLERNYAWVPLLVGGGTLWVLVTLLFLLAYLVRRWRGRAKLARWAAEEQAEREQQASRARQLLEESSLVGREWLN